MSQWECVLKNLGEWRGSFTHFSPQGEERADVPSVITLEGRDDNCSIDLMLKRFYPSLDGGAPRCHELPMTFSSPGRGAFFFETGAFSRGPSDASPTSQCVAEFSLMTPERRSRQVHMFDATGLCQQVTLIREQRAHATAPERPPLQVDDLLGTWHQQWVTRYPGRAEIPEYARSTIVRSPLSSTHVESIQHPLEAFASSDPMTIRLTRTTPSILQFAQGGHAYQMLLLPDAAFATYPIQLQPRQAFWVEAGWMLESGGCQRLIRRYDASGDWVNVSWVQEARSSSVVQRIES